MAVVIVTIVTLICAYAAHVLAPRKGRARKWWVFWSLFLGPIPAIILSFLPDRDGAAAAAS